MTRIELLFVTAVLVGVAAGCTSRAVVSKKPAIVVEAARRLSVDDLLAHPADVKVTPPADFSPGRCAIVAQVTTGAGPLANTKLTGFVAVPNESGVVGGEQIERTSHSGGCGMSTTRSHHLDQYLRYPG